MRKLRLKAQIPHPMANGWKMGRLGFKLTSPRRKGFLNLSTLDIWGQIILCGGGCPLYCSMFQSISGLYPLEASSTPPPHCDNQIYLQTLLNVPQQIFKDHWSNPKVRLMPHYTMKSGTNKTIG